MNPTISIIIPVYRAQKYIKECIDSILSQRYTDFELILVDDGSPDQCPLICDRYAEKDSRVRVIHQNNCGVSKARNVGMHVAVGRYIMFVDSDDYIDKDMLVDGIEHMEFESDLYISGTIMETYDGEKLINTKEYAGKEQIYITKSLLESIDIDFPMICIGGPCSKLFDSQIIKKNKLFFDTSMSVSEDTLFCIEYLKNINYISFSCKSFYHYRRGNEESLWSSYHDDLFESQVRTYGEMRKLIFMKNCLQSTKEKFELLYFDILIGCLQNACRNRKKVGRVERIEIIRKISKDQYVRMLIYSDVFIGKKREIIACLLKIKAFSILDFGFCFYYLLSTK